MKSLMFISLFLIGGSLAAFWDDLRVRYDINPVGHYNRMPKTQAEAEELGWESVSSDCTNGGAYLGNRHVIPGDYSLILSYDVNGVIAGLQMLIAQEDVLTPNNTFRYADIPAFTEETFDGKLYFILTAYFVEPEIICTTGRNETDLINEGTGQGVWIQNSTVPDNFLQIPMLREDAINSGWSDNNCFPGMGSHSWYKMEEYQETNCEIQYPVFSLYNRQMELQGFGFSQPGFVENPHFENPPRLAIEVITGDPAPECLLEFHDLGKIF